MQRETIYLVSDLNGATIPDGEGQTVPFALDGVEYEIDLHNDDAEDLRATLQAYIQHARKVGRAQRQAPARKSSGGGRTRYNRETTKQIRDWGRGEGFELSDRGRVPNNVVEAWEQAHPTERAA